MTDFKNTWISRYVARSNTTIESDYKLKCRVIRSTRNTFAHDEENKRAYTAMHHQIECV